MIKRRWYFHYIGIENIEDQDVIIEQLLANQSMYIEKTLVVSFWENGTFPSAAKWNGLVPKSKPFLRGVVIKRNGELRDVEGR